MYIICLYVISSNFISVYTNIYLVNIYYIYNIFFFLCKWFIYLYTYIDIYIYTHTQFSVPYIFST